MSYNRTRFSTLGYLAAAFCAVEQFGFVKAQRICQVATQCVFRVASHLAPFGDRHFGFGGRARLNTWTRSTTPHGEQEQRECNGQPH